MRFVFFILLVLFIAHPAAAQDVSDDVVSVRGQLDREALDRGIHAGGMIVYPGIKVEEIYDNNIYRTPNNEENDFITSVKPDIEVKTNWNRHELSLKGGADLGYYADHGDEDYADYNASFSGRYDIAHQTYMNGKVQYEHLHEDRSDPNDAGGDEPTEYDRTTAEVGFRRGLAKLKLDLGARYRDYNYEDSWLGNVRIDNSARDHDEQHYKARVSYEYIPHYEVYLQGTYDDRNYDGAGALDRSSNGYGVSAGTAVNISGKMKGELYGGYLARYYEGAYEDIEKGNFGGSLLWNISGLTSVQAEAGREIIEAVSPGISGYVRTGGEVSVEHALRRFLLLDAYGGYDSDEYVGSATNREDDTLRAGAGMEYRMGRYTTFTLGYGYKDRDSNVAAEDYTNHRVMTSLGVKY